MSKSTFSLAALLALTITFTASAQKKPTTARVTTSIQGLGPDTVPTLRVQSDLRGAYQGGVDSVTSEIQPIGDWVLDTTSSATRKILVDLRDPVPDTNPNNLPPPFEFAYVSSRLITRCAQYGLNLRAMSFVGQQYLCGLSIGAITSGGQEYALRMNAATYPTTEETIWTCTSVDSASKCKQWRMEPSGAFWNGIEWEKKSRAKLLRVITSRGQTTYEDRGEYYLSFVFDVTNP